MDSLRLRLHTPMHLQEDFHFDYSQIIFATMLGFVLFGEIPDKYSFTGYVLIILASLGTFLYNMRVAKAGK